MAVMRKVRMQIDPFWFQVSGFAWFVALVRFRVTPITPQSAHTEDRRQLPGSAARA